MTKKWDGLDEAIIGTALVWDTSGRNVERVVYGGEDIVSIFIKRDGMTYLEAIEWIDFNIEGAYIGEDTPIIVWKEGIESVKESVIQ